MKLEEMPMKVWESKMIRQMLSLIQLNLGNDFQWDDFFSLWFENEIRGVMEIRGIETNKTFKVNRQRLKPFTKDFNYTRWRKIP